MSLLALPQSLPVHHSSARRTISKDPRTRRTTRILAITSSKEVERGVEFSTGDSFYRRESAVGRDLGVLVAALHFRQLSRPLRLLDAMCGCGVRSLRYLSHAAAGFVWANDASEFCRPLILSNLSNEPRFSPDGERRWVVTHLDANRLLVERYLQKDFFDFVDIDSFGSDSTFLRSAIMAVKRGGLLYLTSTDGYSSGGHRPLHSLDAYGSYVRPMPYSNELGLRMLIAGALREAATLGYHISPIFSYYSYHGPVFRVMLRVDRGVVHSSHFAFISYCNHCGNSRAFSWEELGRMHCACNNGGRAPSLVVSGPLWTGPLHDAAYLTEMLKLAEDWGWACTNNKCPDLEKLLNLMIGESDPQLTFGYIKLDEVAKRGKINSPPLSLMIDALRKEGYAASRSHISPNAVKTNCPMAVTIQIARSLRLCHQSD